MNLAVISGRLTRAVDFRYTPSGQGVARFTVAVDKGLSKQKKQEFEAQGKATADFINCVAWGKQAEFANNYLFKGGQVMVQGSITTGGYTAKEGHTVYTTDINCYKIEPIDWKSKEQDEGTFDFEADFDTGSDNDGRIPF